MISNIIPLSDKEKERQVDRFSKVNAIDRSIVQGTIDNSGLSFNKSLDELAFAASSSEYKFQPSVKKVLDSNEDKYKKGMRHLSKGQRDEYLKGVARKAAKDSGIAPEGITSTLYGWDVEKGWGHTLQQARNATIGQRLIDVVGHMNPFGGSSRDSLSSAMGFHGRHAKITAAKEGSILGRAMLHGGGILSGVTALDSEDPLSNYAMWTAFGYGGQQGYRIGKSIANLGLDVIKSDRVAHAARLAAGGVGAISFAGLMGGSVWSGNDLTKADSQLTKYFKNKAKAETTVSTYDGHVALTMRQAGLAKLSSSSLNNRGQLLGNEALVLRNMQV